MMFNPIKLVQTLTRGSIASELLQAVLIFPEANHRVIHGVYLYLTMVR